MEKLPYLKDRGLLQNSSKKSATKYKNSKENEL